MAITVRVPSALRKQTGGAMAIELEADNVAQALERLDLLHPALRSHLRDEQGLLRPKVQVYVNDVHVRFLQGVQTPLSDGDRIYVVPNVMGG
jgi:molybdopterin synthase sulfur carrier subunit